MLELTDGAAVLIRELLDRPEFPSGSGVRITGEPDVEPGLIMRAAFSPRFGDQVVEDNGARVFVGRDAAELVHDKVLDATVDTGGQFRFVLSTQG